MRRFSALHTVRGFGEKRLPDCASRHMTPPPARCACWARETGSGSRTWQPVEPTRYLRGFRDAGAVRALSFVRSLSEVILSRGI